MITTETPRVPRIGRATKVIAAALAVTAFLATVGSAPAVASWSASAMATSTAVAPSIAVAHAGFDTLGTTFLHSSSDQRGGFTITNTGGLDGTATLDISTTGAAAANIKVFAWWAASLPACTSEPVPVSAAEGTWAAFPAVDTALAPGASVALCVRSWAADADALATASGAQTMTATATARLTAGSWSVSASDSTDATMSTKAFYPLATVPVVGTQNNWFSVRSVANSGQCLDAFNTGTTAGTAVGIWTCAAQSNHRFEIQPTQEGLSGLRPKTSAELSVGQVAERSALATPGASASNWRIEQVTPTTYQLVNAVSGLCLTTVTLAQNQLIECSGSIAQQFTLERDPMTCTAAGASLTFNVKTPLQNRAYTVQNRLDGGAWVDVYSHTTLSHSSFAVPRTLFGGNGTLDVRVIDSRGNTLYSGMTVITTASTITCGVGFS